MPRLETGLRRARQKSGFTQGELAGRAGISRQTLSILESGRGQPSTVVALRLARVLRCRVEELFWLREEGGVLRAELASAGERRRAPSPRALVGSVAGRWVAHPLRRHDPLGLTTAADALLSRGPRGGELARLSALRPLEALQANVLVTGCDPGLSVLAGRVEDRWPGPTRTSRARTCSTRRPGNTTSPSSAARSAAGRWWSSPSRTWRRDSPWPGATRCASARRRTSRARTSGSSTA